jgi:UDP-3-O-acyl N-acetylglucosamine deacetylase
MRFQRTIRESVALEGKGIHSGEDVRITIKDAPVDTGIIFIRSDLKNKPAIAANASNLVSYSNNRRCTAIEKNSASVYMVEHLMAALSSLNIDNARIEIDNRELPALDGSALDYALELQKAGCIKQEKEKRELILKYTVWSSGENSVLVALPSEKFIVSSMIEYGSSELMTQCVSYSFDSPQKKEDTFIKELAPARTYCLESEVAVILEKGLGKGASYKNALVIKDGKPVDNEFRLVNEPVRHKVVDLLGDLALLNVDIKAHIIGIRSGHSLNEKLLRGLAKLL